MSPTANQQVMTASQPEILLEVQTMFPFDLIPDRIMLTSLSIVVIKRRFLTSETMTFQLSDIMNVELSTSLFTSTLTLIRKMTPLPAYKIRNLENSDGEKLNNMIQGLMVLNTEKIDLAKADSSQIKEKATTIGEMTA